METVKISWRSFFRTVFTIALPIAFQNFLSTTASMVDTIMIGSQGELSVAAVGICSQITSLFFPAILASRPSGCCFSRSTGVRAMRRASAGPSGLRFCVCLRFRCCLG